MSLCYFPQAMPVIIPYLHLSGLSCVPLLALSSLSPSLPALSLSFPPSLVCPHHPVQRSHGEKLQYQGMIDSINNHSGCIPWCLVKHHSQNLHLGVWSGSRCRLHRYRCSKHQIHLQVYLCYTLTASQKLHPLHHCDPPNSHIIIDLMGPNCTKTV
jgi:hypothetical protein